MFSLRTAALAVGLCSSFPARVWAQIDYRNLDDDRPVVTEDAYPVERYAFELLGAISLRGRGRRRPTSYRRTRSSLWSGPECTGGLKATACRRGR